MIVLSYSLYSKKGHRDLKRHSALLNIFQVGGNLILSFKIGQIQEFKFFAIYFTNIQHLIKWNNFINRFLDLRDTNLCSRCIYLILDLFTVPQEHSLKVVPEFKKLEVTGGFQVDLQKEAVLKMPSSLS